MKKLISYSVFCTSILFSTSFCKFNWVGLNLSTNDVTNCVNFQLTRGGNCISDFEKLKPVLDKFIELRYTIDRLPEVLGVPNQTIEGSTLIYNLNANTVGCKAILKVKNNELISYSVEGCN
jgi:hypothetical protein